MIRAIPFVVLLVLVSFSLCGCSDQSSSEELQQKAKKLLEEGKYDEAIASAKKGLEAAEKSPDKHYYKVTEALVTLGWIYERQKKYAEAETFFKRSLEIREQGLSDLYLVLLCLSGLYEEQGKYAQAEALAERNLAIHKTRLGPDDPQVNILTQDLATIYEKQGKKREAYELLKAARLIPEEQGKDHDEAIRRGLEKAAGKLKPMVAAKERAVQTAKASTAPSLIIHNARAEPSTASKGGRIALLTECSVADHTRKESKISVKVSYSMLRGDTVLGEQPATDLDLRNGQKLRIRKGVTMPKEAGSYSVLIKMIYKDKVATKQVPIKVR